MTRYRRFCAKLFVLCSIAAVLSASGCGSKSTVKGKVLYKDKRLANAEVVFQLASDPVEQNFPGNSSNDGEYVLDTRGQGGIPPGEYKVLVKWWTLRNGKPLPSGEEGDALKFDPAKVTPFAVTFEKTVEPGENEINLPVEKGKRRTAPD